MGVESDVLQKGGGVALALAAGEERIGGVGEERRGEGLGGQRRVARLLTEQVLAVLVCEKRGTDTLRRMSETDPVGTPFWKISVDGWK